jgi:hypothetical protein
MFLVVQTMLQLTIADQPGESRKRTRPCPPEGKAGARQARVKWPQVPANDSRCS